MLANVKSAKRPVARTGHPQKGVSCNLTLLNVYAWGGGDRNFGILKATNNQEEKEDRVEGWKLLCWGLENY